MKSAEVHATLYVGKHACPKSPWLNNTETITEKALSKVLVMLFVFGGAKIKKTGQ